MIWFQLGREYKLSVAEILTVFPKGKTVYLNMDFLILDKVDQKEVLKNANRLWGVIKIVQICDTTYQNDLVSDITNVAKGHEGKFKYWLSVFWEKRNLKDILIKQKKELKKNDISSRFVNKDFNNLSSAQIIWEKLVQKNTDFNYIYAQDTVYCGRTIWVQDINSYSKRDYWKDRDMLVGMLPPKLCQMMINISWGKTIYDPFVWLWTILIESIYMWNTQVYWSDLNERMVDVSQDNINKSINSCMLHQWECNNVNYQIDKLNAKFIDESKILQSGIIDSIVTEWYLWEIMTKKNISLERIDKQKQSLLSIYSKFFEWLKKIKYKWNIVICFPFWENKWKYSYFQEVYDILDTYCSIQSMYPKDYLIQTSKSWSLLYKREKQLVGRELFKLKLK